MFKFKINLSLLKSKQALERGAALAELALSFPVALTIVLVTIHLSHVLRESNVVVEAARHGARSVAAASGESPLPNPPFHDLPTWSDIVTPNPIPPENIKVCSEFPTGLDTVGGIATDAACGYLAEYFDSKWDSEKPRWKIISNVSVSTVDSSSFWFITVQVTAVDDRGPVDQLRGLFGLKPDMSATFPLMRVE